MTAYTAFEVQIDGEKYPVALVKTASALRAFELLDNEGLNQSIKIEESDPTMKVLAGCPDCDAPDQRVFTVSRLLADMDDDEVFVFACADCA